MKRFIDFLKRVATNPWAIVLLVAVLYLGARVPRISGGPLQGVDMPVILDALETDHSARAVLSWFTGPWVQGPSYYRPLTSLVHWTNFMLCGRDGFCWRMVNALIVAATMPALVWMFAAGFRRPWAGVIAAGLLPWLDPLTEMVFYPAWRTDLLCGLFLVLATGAGLSYLRQGRPRRLWLMLGMLLLAIWSKEVAFAWPAFLAVSCLVVRRDVRALKAIGAAAGLAGGMWLVRVHALGTPLLGAPIAHVDFPLSRQLQVFAKMLFAPLYYDVTRVYPTLIGEPHVWFDPGFYGLIALDLAFIAANVILLRAAPRILAIIWAWRALLYLPSMPFAGIFSFYLYIPMLGSTMLYGAAAGEAAGMVSDRIASRTSAPRSEDGNDEVECGAALD